MLMIKLGENHHSLQKLLINLLISLLSLRRKIKQLFQQMLHSTKPSTSHKRILSASQCRHSSQVTDFKVTPKISSHNQQHSFTKRKEKRDTSYSSQQFPTTLTSSQVETNPDKLLMSSSSLMKGRRATPSFPPSFYHQWFHVFKQAKRKFHSLFKVSQFSS